LPAVTEPDGPGPGEPGQRERDISETGYERDISEPGDHERDGVTSAAPRGDRTDAS
jgi:hypothetical protein